MIAAKHDLKVRRRRDWLFSALAARYSCRRASMGSIMAARWAG